MELIRGLPDLQRREGGCAVTIGTYDGVHLGHQALLRRLKERAAQLALPTVVLTFEPTPREYLAPNAPPARLTSAWCAPVESWPSAPWPPGAPASCAPWC